MSLRFLPYGDRAVLAEVGDDGKDGDVHSLSARARVIAGTLDVVPGARAVLVSFDPLVITVEALVAALRAATGETSIEASRDPVELSVRYDGVDLENVAGEVGMSVDELVERHAAAPYRVAFCGFAPGFAYLSGLDPALRVARLSEPRTTVPAGSVGIAGDFTGVYPRASPGGWRLLGRTEVALWDSARLPPALLVPGTPVRFRPT